MFGKIAEGFVTALIIILFPLAALGTVLGMLVWITVLVIVGFPASLFRNQKLDYMVERIAMSSGERIYKICISPLLGLMSLIIGP